MDSFYYIYYNIIFTIRGNDMPNSKSPIIGIVMGSDSDWPIMKLAAEVLDEFDVEYESKIVSAHRTPDEMYEYADNAKNRGIKCIIAGAGGAAVDVGAGRGARGQLPAPRAAGGGGSQHPQRGAAAAGRKRLGPRRGRRPGCRRRRRRPQRRECRAEQLRQWRATPAVINYLWHADSRRFRGV